MRRIDWPTLASAGGERRTPTVLRGVGVGEGGEQLGQHLRQQLLHELRRRDAEDGLQRAAQHLHLLQAAAAADARVARDLVREVAVPFLEEREEREEEVLAEGLEGGEEGARGGWGEAGSAGGLEDVEEGKLRRGRTERIRSLRCLLRGMSDDCPSLPLLLLLHRHPHRPRHHSSRLLLDRNQNPAPAEQIESTA